MGVETNIKSHLPRHHMAAGSQRFAVASRLNAAPTTICSGLADAAPHLFDAREIFKKTLNAAGLQRAGRDVAKDMHDIGTIPLLMKPLPEQGILNGAGVNQLNVKLTDKECAARKTKLKLRATNHSSGALWKDAQQVGPAANGAAIRAGGAHEKYYADV